MMGWQPIETAPKDGSEVIAVCESRNAPKWSMLMRFPYPLPSKFTDGKWHADFGDRWAPYDPQPTHWKPLAPTAPDAEAPGT